MLLDMHNPVKLFRENKPRKQLMEQMGAAYTANGIITLAGSRLYTSMADTDAVIDDALILTIDPAYFDLTGGLDRWLYRIVRKHGGRQRNGWRFDFRHLHQKSGALSPFKRFAFELRDIIRRQPLPGYTLFAEVETGAYRSR